MFCSVCYCLANKASIFVVENTTAKPLCFSSTIYLSMVTLRQPLKNKNPVIKNLIRLNCENYPKI